MSDLMKHEVVNRIQNIYGLSVIYSEICGSQKYKIRTAHDLDILVIVEDKPSNVPYLIYDEGSGAHVFVRDRRNVEDLLNFRITPKNFDLPFYAGLTAECCALFGFDFFAHLRELKSAAHVVLSKSCCSGNLVIQNEEGNLVSTRQSKGLYHALALMYKIKSKSLELTEDHLLHMTEAHDKVLPDEIIDEIYGFYGL